MAEQAKMIKDKAYYKDPADVIELAKHVEREKMLDMEGVNVGFVLVDPMISGKSVVAKTINANNEVKLYSDYDFIIELSMDVWDMINDDIRYKIIEHNLRSIFVDENDSSGKIIMKKMQPDIQEFFPMLRDYGVEWISELKTITESVRELEVLEKVDY